MYPIYHLFVHFFNLLAKWTPELHRSSLGIRVGLCVSVTLLVQCVIHNVVCCELSDLCIANCYSARVTKLVSPLGIN